jgi:creatinine amidohydrolase/Fe(II)-dependent formamide hydrolase-like protein
VINRHGAPLHNEALLDAAEYFTHRYDGTMVPLTSLIYSGTNEAPVPLDSEASAEHGVDVHAGVEETSQTLFLEPALVADDYRTAPRFAAASTAALSDIAAAPDWPGYFGSPRLATVSAGARIVEHRTQETIELALRILDGFDWRTLPTRADRGDTDAAFRALNENARTRSETERISQEKWLRAVDVR